MPGVRDVQLPEGVLVCNFPRGLMSHQDVVTLFHEFGHLMHHVLAGRHRWVRFAGVATEWDFVEAPSQMLEEWAWDAEVLASFATDESGEPIPADLVARMRAADEFGKGYLAGAQMFYAAVSYRLHLERPADIGARVRELWAAYNLIAPLPEGRFFTAFGHLGGYSSAYYTYMWSLVIAKDLFGAFDPDDLFDPECLTPLSRPGPGARRQQGRRRPGRGLPGPALRRRGVHGLAGPEPGAVSFPHLDLAANAHDRAGVRRVDDAWLDERWSDPETRVLVVAGTRLRPADGAVDWRPTADVPDGTRVLLGERDGRTWFAVLVDPAEAPGERGDWVGLRALLPLLAAGPVDEAPLLFHAIGLAEWHYATRFCPRCGTRLESRAAGHELSCPGCGKTQFPRTDPAVIMAVTHGERRRRGAAARAPALLARGALLHPGRLLRAGRDARGRRTP